MAPGFWAAAFGGALVAAAPAMADEAPKYGGILTYMIPADSPPSFDAQREETYATIHSAAPFYSVLIRINPNNPQSTTDIVCDLCTEMPQPTDGGKTYTFKIRDDVSFHNGDKLTAEDVAASLNKIAFPRQQPDHSELQPPRHPLRSPPAEAYGRFRRFPPVPLRPREGPLPEPIAGVQPRRRNASSSHNTRPWFN